MENLCRKRAILQAFAVAVTLWPWYGDAQNCAFWGTSPATMSHCQIAGPAGLLACYLPPPMHPLSGLTFQSHGLPDLRLDCGSNAAA